MTPLPPIIDGRRRWVFVRLVGNGILQSVMIVGSMLLVRHAFDVLLNPAFDDPEVHLFELTDVSHIWWLAIGLLGCTGLAAWLRLTEQIDAEKLGQEYVHRIRLVLYDHMGKCAPRVIGRRSTGATMLRFVGDLTALRRWVSRGLARILVSSIVTCLALGFLATLDAYLAGISALILSAGLVWNLRLGPRMHAAVTEARRRRGHLAGNINEKIRAFIVIQAFNQLKPERRRFSRQSRQLRDAMISRARASSRMRVVTEGSTAASMGLVLSIGALEVFKGLTTSGNVVAAMAVVGFLSTAFRDLGRVHEFHQSAKVSKNKLEQFLRTRTMKGRSSRLPSLQVTAGELALRKVTLEGTLTDVSATAPGGARVALIGPNGAGKSTLMHVAARLIDPSSGAVLIDGQDIATCNLASVRRAIGIVSPDLPLMRGSIRYNLRYRWPDAPEEEVSRVRKLCQLDELIDQFAEGENHRLLEGGTNLSLGQRHRLAVARALLGEPEILMVDEIDANLDRHVAGVLDRVLDEFKGTVLIVTRTEARLGRADWFWHLQDGRLTRTGQQLESVCRLMGGDSKVNSVVI